MTHTDTPPQPPRDAETEPDQLAVILDRLDAIESEHRRTEVARRLDALAENRESPSTTPARSTTLDVNEQPQQPEPEQPEDPEDDDVDTERLDRPRPQPAKRRPAKRPPRPRRPRPAQPASPEETNR